MASLEVSKDHLPQTFSLWSSMSLGWLTINSFGGLSFILFIGLSAGGIPAILYGFVGSTACVLCITLTFSQCAARFSTAGGAYHYAVFLTPEKYRRVCAYPLGWLNFAGWILTHAACCSIVATLTLALANLCQPEFDVSRRWILFLVYLAIASLCWLINLFGLKSIPKLELFGCWVTVLGFVAYSILLIVKAPKASSHFVFVQTSNDTGYPSTAFAIFLGLMNSFSTLMGLDGAAHLAEEVPQPKRVIPKANLLVVLSQFIIGVVWIIVLGFSIKDLPSIVGTTTGVPILELIRLATGSNAAAIAFCLILMINNGTSALASATTMSRQGYAFARDGGLFWNNKLSQLSPRTHLPIWTINLCSAVVVLIGLIYLFSSAAFNAIIGAQVTCMIVSYGSPSLILLLTRKKHLSPGRWSLGRWSEPTYVVAVVYSSIVIIVAMIPQSHPVTAVSMNYTILIMSVFVMLMTTAWFTEGRKLFVPPSNEEDISAELFDGVEIHKDEEIDMESPKGAAKAMVSPVV